MTSDPYPGDSLTLTALDADDVPLSEEDESDESTLVNSTAAYGSLMGLGGGAKRKKQCALMLDPDEAEAEARRIQFVGAQQFGCADEPAPLDRLAEPLDFAAEEEPQADRVWPEPEFEAEAETGFAAEPAPVAAPEDAVPAWPESFAEPEPEPEIVAARPLAEQPADILEDAPAAAFRPDAGIGQEPADFWVFSSDEDEPEAPAIATPPLVVEPVPEAWGGSESVAAIAEARIMPPPPAPPGPKLDYGHPGHSLRQRVPRQPRRRTLGQRVVTVLRWLAARLRRRP